MQLLKYLPRIINKRGMPLNVIYFVTSKCNAQCGHCFYWNRLNTVKDELTLAEIEKTAKNIPDIISLSLTGGEPFLRSDLIEIASIFSKFTRVSYLQIPSNGILTDTIIKTIEEIIKRCRKNILISVGISIDDLFDKHDILRQTKGCFSNATETLKKLKLLEAKYKNFRVGCIITINKNNQKNIISMVDFLKREFSVDEIGINLIRSEVKNPSLKEINIQYYDEIMLKLRRDFLCRAKDQPASWIDRVLSARQYYGALLLSKIFSQNKYVTPCYAGSLLAIIRENGDVNPCEMLDDRMGNLRDFNYNFKELWFSKEAERIRKTIKRNRCFCTYECAATFNTLFNATHLFHIIKGSLLK